MATTNTFYRFSQGWNVGFFPDNKIVSNLLDEISADLSSFLPTIPLGVSPNEFISQVIIFISEYNTYPYYGNFVVEYSSSSCAPNECYTIIIKDEAFFNLYNQYLQINATFSNPNLELILVSLEPFAPIAFTGTFEKFLIEEERRVKSALEIFVQNGGATIPTTFRYFENTKVAQSGLARAANWKIYDNNEVNRDPSPTIPKLNRRIFTLPELNADDLYVCKIIEIAINYSLYETNSAQIILKINDYDLPDGWSKTINTTNERIQTTFEEISGRRKFILVGRFNVVWTWQRFVSDDDNAAFDFLAAYPDSTALPYEPIEASRWLYNSDTYDFEFVVFDNCSNEPKEFYPMPAKPGDGWQFNIIDGNITGLSSVNIGLFTQSGDFIQKIGEAELLPTPSCECVDCAFIMELNFNEEAFANYLDQLNEILVANPGNNVFLFKYEFLIDGVIQSDPNEGAPFEPGFEFNTTNIFDYCNFAPGIELELVDGLYRFSLEVPNAVCGSIYQFNQYFAAKVDNASPSYQLMWDSDIYECPTPVPLYELQQYQATVTIPSKQGCYRMGLYEIVDGTGPSTDCNLSIVYYLSQDFNDGYTGFIEAMDAIAATANPYITFEINGNKYTYEVPSTSPTLDAVTAWATNNILGMTADAYDDTGRAFFKWEGTVECGEEGYTIKCYHSDSIGTEIDAIWESESKLCNCEPHCTIGGSINVMQGPGDCTSDFYNEVLTYPSEYVALQITQSITNTRTTINKVPCSSITSQDSFLAWLNSIPGFFIFRQDDPNGDGCFYPGFYNMDIPCDNNEYLWEVNIVDSNDTYITDVDGLQGYANSCECNSTCEATFTYTITENATQWLTDLITAELPLYSIFIESGGVVYNQYFFPIGPYTTINEAVFYFNSIPGMTCTFDGESVMTWTWTTQIPCDTEATMNLGGLDYYLSIDNIIWTTDLESCSCPIVPEPGQFYSALYSLSNIINIDASDCFSTIIEFWGNNNTMAQGFEYYNNWKQIIRLGINGGGEKPIIIENIYRQSNGVYKRPQNKQDLSIDLHTDFLDFETQKALVDATRHPFFVWNNQNLFVRGDIEVATIQDFTTQSSFENLAQVKFSALVQGFQPKNNTCLNC